MVIGHMRNFRYRLNKCIKVTDQVMDRVVFESITYN